MRMTSAVLISLIEFDDTTIQQWRTEKKVSRLRSLNRMRNLRVICYRGKDLTDAVFILHTLSFMFLSRHLISMTTKRNNTLLGQITKDFSDTRRLIDHVIR